MKLLPLFIVFFFIAENSHGQENFVWTVNDTVNKPKEEIYSDTKLLIARIYKSAQHVIQLDDKDAGIILIKTNQPVYVQRWNGTYTYTYAYTTTFRFKDGKYKITIDNIHCISTNWSSSTQTPLCIEPFNDINDYKVCFRCVYKKVAKEVMDGLKEHMQETLDLCAFNLNKETIISDDW